VSLSLCLVLPWVSYSLSTTSVSFWIVGVYSVLSTGFGISYSGASIWFFDLSSSTSIYPGFFSGLVAGVVFCAAAHIASIVAAVHASRALRLLRGGRRLCCSSCDCACVCCTCCCPKPAVDDGGRFLLARSAARCATGASIAAGVCAAIAAGAVNSGAASFLASVRLGGGTSSTIGVGVAAWSVVSALLAALFAAAAAAVVTVQDVTGVGGPLGGGVVLMQPAVMLAMSPMQVAPPGAVIYAATAPPGMYPPPPAVPYAQAV